MMEVIICDPLCKNLAISNFSRSKVSDPLRSVKQKTEKKCSRGKNMCLDRGYNIKTEKKKDRVNRNYNTNTSIL